MKQLKHQAELLDEILVLLVKYKDTLGVDHVAVCGECQRIKLDAETRPHYNRFKSAQAMIDKVVEWVDTDHFPDGEPEFIKTYTKRNTVRYGA